MREQIHKKIILNGFCFSLILLLLHLTTVQSTAATAYAKTQRDSTNLNSLLQNNHIQNFFSRRRRRHDDRSNVSETIPTSSSYSSYDNTYRPPPSRFPIIPYTPGVKPWRIQPTTSRYKPRYSSKSKNIFTGVLESLSSKILASNIFTFGIQTLNPTVTKLGAKVSHLLVSQPHRLLTPIFLHGGIGHLMMNSYSLNNIGPHVESLFGPGRFLATYLMSGVAGNILSGIMTPNPSVGASGAIFGLIGAYYVFLTRNEVFFGASGERGKARIQQTLLLNVALGFSSPNIDNWGHIGGAIGGATMAYLFGPKLYLMDMGMGPASLRMVDVPLISFGDSWSFRGTRRNISSSWQRLKRKMQVDGQYANLPVRRWRKMKN